MRAILALEDGFTLTGSSFTGPGETSGEVIFNTGMTGYQEVLTDPSYAGQMVCMTYPLIGNYGINAGDMESRKVFVEGFIVKECCKTPSNWRSTMSLPEYLIENGIMGIEHIDTRALTRHLRLHGAKRGVIATVEHGSNITVEDLVRRAQQSPTMEGRNLADAVTLSEPYIWTGETTAPAEIKDGVYAWPGPGPRVVVFDFGVKWNILRLLAEQGFDLLVVPSSYTAEQVARLSPDAIFLSNGPGDPAALTATIDEIKRMTDEYPVAGICLGHQLLGHALGGTTFKLKFGHHGCNHPVKDLINGHIEISSQNHGFCVDIDSLKDVETTHVNLNDQTLEGFAHKTKPVIAIQFHPESNPGPHDSRNFFNRFRNLVREAVGR